jgi:hypothetical protein
MTIRDVDSFDHYQTADLLLKYTSRAAVTDALGGDAYPRIETTKGRYSNGCLAIAGFRTGGGSNQSASLTKSLGANDRRIIRHFGVKAESAYTQAFSIILLDGATDQAFWQINTAGQLVVGRGGGTVLGTSVATVSTGTWHHIVVDITIGDATGSSATWGAFEVWLNGVSVLSATNVDTKATANAYANAYRYVVTGGNGTTNSTNSQVMLIDDSITDSATNWGDKRVQVLRPNGAGASTQFTPSAGSNYACVDDTLLDTSDYVESTVVGNIDTYACEDVSASASVSAVVVTMVANKTDAGARSIRGVLRIGGTNYTNGADLALSATDTVQQAIFETNPATAGAWTASALNGAEIGIKDAA